MKRLVTSTLVVPLLIAGPAAAAPASVSVDSFFFKKSYVEVDPGDTVTWTNTGSIRHTVTSRSGVPQAFDSGDLDAGKTYAVTFSKPGTYAYYCTLHPTQMSGVVQVGPDRVAPTLRAPATTASAKRIRLSFRLSEDAKVAVTLKRGSKAVKTVRTSTLHQGRNAATFTSKKGFRPGRYKVVAAATDRAGNKSRALSASIRLR